MHLTSSVVAISCRPGTSSEHVIFDVFHDAELCRMHVIGRSAPDLPKVAAWSPSSVHGSADNPWATPCTHC